jgi:hypothetical protein
VAATGEAEAEMKVGDRLDSREERGVVKDRIERSEEVNGS